jgi:hypothetical protein
VGDGDDEEGVAWVCDTGKGVVPGSPLVGVLHEQRSKAINLPRGESGKDTKGTTSSQQTSVSVTSGVVVQVGKAEEEECHVKREEEDEESDGRAECANQQQESEDEPSEEIETERVRECGCRFFLERRHDCEATGSEDDSRSNPEASVRRESGGTESVASGHFPAVKVSL